MDAYKQKAASCVQSHTVRHIKHTRTRTHGLFVAPASFLSLHADCVSGTEG